MGLDAGSDPVWVPGVACPDAPVDDVSVGESVGEGDPLPGELVVGVAVGDVGLVVGEVGPELGDVDVEELPDGLADAELALQLGDPLPDGLTG